MTIVFGPTGEAFSLNVIQPCGRLPSFAICSDTLAENLARVKAFLTMAKRVSEEMPPLRKICLVLAVLEALAREEELLESPEEDRIIDLSKIF